MSKKSDLIPSQVQTSRNSLKEIALLFFGGAGAGLITLILVWMSVLDVWSIQPLLWAIAVVTISCGLLAVFFCRNFEKMLTALLDNAPEF